MSSFLHFKQKYTLHNEVKRSSTEPAEAQKAALDLATPITVEVHRECVCVCMGEEALRSSTATETTENTGFLVFPALKQVLMSSFVSPVEMLP